MFPVLQLAWRLLLFPLVHLCQQWEAGLLESLMIQFGWILSLKLQIWTADQWLQEEEHVCAAPANSATANEKRERTEQLPVEHKLKLRWILGMESLNDMSDLSAEACRCHLAFSNRAEWHLLLLIETWNSYNHTSKCSLTYSWFKNCSQFLQVDLLCAQVSGLPVADVMDTWTKQMGYPVVQLSLSDTSASLTQRRFLLDPKANATQPPSPFRSVKQRLILT